jgi:hypothetical protein
MANATEPSFRLFYGKSELNCALLSTRRAASNGIYEKKQYQSINEGDTTDKTPHAIAPVLVMMVQRRVTDAVI